MNISDMANKVDWWAEAEEQNDNKLTSKGEQNAGNKSRRL